MKYVSKINFNAEFNWLKEKIVQNDYYGKSNISGHHETHAFHLRISLQNIRSAKGYIKKKKLT